MAQVLHGRPCTVILQVQTVLHHALFISWPGCPWVNTYHALTHIQTDKRTVPSWGGSVTCVYAAAAPPQNSNRTILTYQAELHLSRDGCRGVACRSPLHSWRRTLRMLPSDTPCCTIMAHDGAAPHKQLKSYCMLVPCPSTRRQRPTLRRYALHAPKQRCARTAAAMEGAIASASTLRLCLSHHSCASSAQPAPSTSGPGGPQAGELHVGCCKVPEEELLVVSIRLDEFEALGVIRQRVVRRQAWPDAGRTDIAQQAAVRV